MKSVLIIGLGRFGRHIARTFIEQGNAVLAIEKQEETADNAIDVIKDIQIGDARNELFIESLGVSNFDLCVVAIGDDFLSVLEITVLLKDHGAKFIIARATRDVYRNLLLRNGADHVVYAEREMAERIAIRFGSKRIYDYMRLGPELELCEIVTPESWQGKTILDKQVRTRYGLTILAVKHDAQVLPVSSPDYRFNAADSLLVLGKRSDMLKSVPPVKRVVRTGAISPCYWPAPKDAGFLFVQALLPSPLWPPLKGLFLFEWIFVFFHTQFIHCLILLFLLSDILSYCLFV